MLALLLRLFRPRVDFVPLAEPKPKREPIKARPAHRICDVFIPPKGEDRTQERVYIPSWHLDRADAFARCLKAEGFVHQLRIIRKPCPTRRALIEDFRL